MLAIIGVIIIIIGICVTIFFASGKDTSCAIISAVVGFILGVGCILLGSVYTQDVGETTVIRNWGGSLAGVSTDAGFHMKTPWQEIIKYDVRNNVLSFMGNAEEEQFEGGSANGSAITINDKGGASAKIDLQVNYSLDPDAAEELYSNYGTQENFVRSVCAVDIRAVPREVSGQFDTITILTARSEFTQAIQEALTSKWKDYGLIVDQVSVQNVVYPENISAKYAEAQAAEVAKAQAQNEQEAAKVKAETKIIEAQGEAQANRELAASLNDQVIQQHYIDALQAIGENGNLVVVPEGSQPIVGTK